MGNDLVLFIFCYSPKISSFLDRIFVEMMSYQSTTAFWLLLAYQINKEFILIEFSWKWWEYFRIFWVDASSQRLSSIPLASCSMPLQNIKGSNASLAIRLFFYFSPNTCAIPQSFFFIFIFYDLVLIRHHDIKYKNSGNIKNMILCLNIYYIPKE